MEEKIISEVKIWRRKKKEKLLKLKGKKHLGFQDWSKMLKTGGSTVVCLCNQCSQKSRDVYLRYTSVLALWLYWLSGDHDRSAVLAMWLYLLFGWNYCLVLTSPPDWFQLYSEIIEPLGSPERANPSLKGEGINRHTWPCKIHPLANCLSLL